MPAPPARSATTSHPSGPPSVPPPRRDLAPFLAHLNRLVAPTPDAPRPSCEKAPDRRCAQMQQRRSRRKGSTRLTDPAKPSRCLIRLVINPPRAPVPVVLHLRLNAPPPTWNPWLSDTVLPIAELQSQNTHTQSSIDKAGPTRFGSETQRQSASRRFCFGLRNLL